VRVLYFSPRVTPHDLRFLNALAATEHTIYTLQMEDTEGSSHLQPPPQSVERIPWPHKPGGSRQSYPEMRRIVKKIVAELKPDVLHAGPLHESAFLCALARVQPLVSMSWGSDLLWQARRSRWTRWMIAHTLKHTTVFTADCQAAADEAARYGFPREKMVLFPWGVDLTHFSPQGSAPIREELGWQDKFVILSLRSWEPVYGVEHVVKGFIAAARENPHLRLLLLGGGSQAAAVRAPLIDAGMQEKVHFGGRIGLAELPAFYRAADLYVSGSFSDGSSVSLMEALACGLPALVSDIEGNREWVEEGKQGWLFPAGDAEAVKRAMLAACEKRAGLAALGDNARKAAEERADWSKNFPKLLDAYALAVAEAH
jgi:glycosyltransferase involved in cell wall biosynthesis